MVVQKHQPHFSTLFRLWEQIQYMCRSFEILFLHDQKLVRGVTTKCKGPLSLDILPTLCKMFGA